MAAGRVEGRVEGRAAGIQEVGVRKASMQGCRGRERSRGRGRG